MPRRPRHKRHRPRRQHRPRRRQSSFNLNRFARRHPITIGILLIIASLILFRLSFTNQFLSSAEFVIWTWLLSVGLFIIGLLVLIAWWRNNVLSKGKHIGIAIGKKHKI